jgi:hypothetical protein
MLLSIDVRFYEPDSKHDSIIILQSYSYSQKDICLFDIDVFGTLLSSEWLVVWNEDLLLEMIVELGCDYYLLLECVRFKFLSLFGISRFVNTIVFIR